MAGGEGGGGAGEGGVRNDIRIVMYFDWFACGHRRVKAPGLIGSALGLVGPVSAFCDWGDMKV